jgi:hypothetical protein
MIDGLTVSSLVARATDVLVSNGFVRVDDDRSRVDAPAGVRMFEDVYSLVGLIGFETFGQLEGEWQRVESAVGDTLGRYLTVGEAKRWDTYLVLMTPSSRLESEDGVEAIEANTSRTRKLVISGDDLRQLADVEEALLPLLPLDTGLAPVQTGDALDRLPALRGRRGVELPLAEALVDAWRKNQTMITQLHEVMHGDPNSHN